MSELIETKRCIKALYKYSSFSFLYFVAKYAGIISLCINIIKCLSCILKRGLYDEMTVYHKAKWYKLITKFFSFNPR